MNRAPYVCSRRYLLGGMRFLEQLFRDLPKIVDEPDCSVSLEWILNAEDVDVSLVEEVMVHVHRVDGRLPLLLVPENLKEQDSNDSFRNSIY